MATQDDFDQKLHAAVRARYDELQLEDTLTQSLRDEISEIEAQISKLSHYKKSLRTRLRETLKEASGLKEGDTVILRNGDKVQIVDFFYDYAFMLDFDTLGFYFKRLNKDGTPNKREKSCYNKASVLDIEKEGN